MLEATLIGPLCFTITTNKTRYSKRVPALIEKKHRPNSVALTPRGRRTGKEEAPLTNTSHLWAARETRRIDDQSGESKGLLGHSKLQLNMAIIVYTPNQQLNSQ